MLLLTNMNYVVLIPLSLCQRPEQVHFDATGFKVSTLDWSVGIVSEGSEAPHASVVCLMYPACSLHVLQIARQVISVACCTMLSLLQATGLHPTRAVALLSSNLHNHQTFAGRAACVWCPVTHHAVPCLIYKRCCCVIWWQRQPGKPACAAWHTCVVGSSRHLMLLSTTCRNSLHGPQADLGPQ